jgi:hypothetical protein
MTAFTVATNTNFDAQTGGSVNATLDTYTLSAGAVLTVRTDTYACPNHSVAFGSLDTVSFTGVGGELRFDPTYVRVVAYTAGSGNSPAYGAAISQGAVSGVFLGAWANWQSEPIVPGIAIPATGFIKIGGKAGGNFAAGALTGVTATCSGADVQGWIEVRGPDTATITVPRIGKVTSVEAWFELGVTDGTRTQVLPCPTTATAAGIFPGVWVESAPGSGVYEPYASVGTSGAFATYRADVSMKVFLQTTAGIRLGSDGTNNVFWLPPAGCRVRIPAVILTNCTRTVSGSGPRILPNTTIGTRQEFITTGAGYFDLRGVASQWYMNFQQAFYVKYKGCAIADAMLLYEIASPLDVDDCIVSPTQLQAGNTGLQIISCFAGGTVKNTLINRATLGNNLNMAVINYVTGITFENVHLRSISTRGTNTSAINSTAAVDCVFNNIIITGSRVLMNAAQRCVFNNFAYYDNSTTTTNGTNPVYGIEFYAASSGNAVNGYSLPLPAVGPYAGLVQVSASYKTTIQNIGTDYDTPLVLNAAITGLGVNGAGNNDGITVKRMYLSNTRSGPYSFVNSDNNILIENVSGDTADTSVMAGLNAVEKNVQMTSATTGQTSVYGSHWKTRYTSQTAGFAEITCNEPTASSAAQCTVTGGSPQFNSGGSVLLTKVGDQVTWEMPYFAVGYTAFTNTAPTFVGNNLVFASNRWGNHTIEFQIDTGSGYGGAWLNLVAANLIAQTITSTTGFRLKILATCAVANATNAITNMRVAMTTTAAARKGTLYPLNVVTLTLTGLVAGSDIVILQAGTSTILTAVDANAGTTYNYVYETIQNVDIGIIKPGCVPLYIRNYPLTASNASLPVAQTADRNYS